MSQFTSSNVSDTQSMYNERLLATSRALFTSFQTGAAIALTFAGARSLWHHQQGILRTAITTSILRTTGVGALTGLLLAIPASTSSWGREEVVWTWKDRTWRMGADASSQTRDARILDLSVYDWSLAGATTGALAGMRRLAVREVPRATILRSIGGAGIGSLVATVLFGAVQTGANKTMRGLDGAAAVAAAV